jgi:hypothetical protein
VYRISPWSGRTKQIATGLAGAANLAVTPWGSIYVSELFGNQVSKIERGRPVPVATLPSPGGLEWRRGKLWVGTDVFESGKLQTISF